MPIEVLDLFSAAAGGWSLGLHRAGFTTIAACEVEPWRRALYSENNPKVKVYHDVRTLTADRLFSDFGRLPSFVVGSPPCQDISSANTKGKGVEGERSGLYFEAIRIIGEVRPRWFALENSANLRTRGADAVCAALEAIGYTSWPLVVRAEDIGANHERARCWLIGCDLDQIADMQQVGRTSWTGSPVAAGRADRGDQSPDDAGNAYGVACGPVGGVCARADAVSSGSAALHAPGIGHEGGRSRGYRTYGIGAAPAVAGHAADAAGFHDEGWEQVRSGREARNQHAGDPVVGRARPLASAGDATDADQARQAHGCVESGLRQAEIADDGRRAGRSDDRSRAGQVGLCTPDRSDTHRRGSGWSLANLAAHLRLDDV